MKPAAHLFVLSWELKYAGGVNEVVRNLFAEFAAKGPRRPMVFTSDWGHTFPAVAEDEGRPTIRFRLRPPYERGHAVKSLLLFLLHLPLTLWRLGAVLRRENVTVVNPHYPGLQFWNFLLARRLGFWRGTLLLSPHGDEVLDATRTRGWERFWWRGIFRAADAIVTPSRHLEEEVAKLDPRLRDKITVVYNGVDAARLEELAEAGDALPSGLDGQPYVLNVGSFEPRKAQDVLLEAFRRVADVRPGIRLVLVGGAGPWSARTDGMIAEHGLSDRVSRYEAVPFPTVVALLRHAELLALPSRHETFGIVLAEAGVFGVPSVAARVGGVPEVIQDGVNGRLVDVEDADALADAILALLDSKEDRERLGAGMRKAVDERFNWSRARDLYAEIV